MGKTILVADKSVTIQKIVQLTFADEDFDVHCVSDGQAALDTLFEIRPDLILADISLPLKSGYDLCNAVRTEPEYGEFSQLPIILLAGIYETMDEERSRRVEEKVREVRASDFLSKPFDPQVLIVKVKDAVRSVSAPDVEPEIALESTESAEEVPQPAEEAPEPTAASPAEPENIFSPVTDSSASFSETLELPDSEYEVPAEEPVPDDNETTVMIPGGVFRENMFAEPLPYEEEPGKAEPQKEPVDVEAVTPVGEPVLEEKEFQDLGEEVVDSLEATRQVEPVEEEGAEELESPFEAEAEFEEAEESVVAREETPNLIVAESDDPFGDVFEEPAGVSWTAPAEEEAPFELPVPAPEIPESNEVEEEPSEQEAAVVEPVVQETVPAATPADYDDTWPGVQGSLQHPVEELFEPESAPTEQEAASEMPEETEGEFAATPSPAPLTGEAVTDDLVNRIAEVVLARLSERIVSEIVWQVVPDLAEKMIRREIEKLHAGEE